MKGSISVTFFDDGIGTACSMNKVFDKKEIKIVIMNEVKTHRI